MYLQAVMWVNENMSIKHLPQTLAYSKQLKKKKLLLISVMLINITIR